MALTARLHDAAVRCASSWCAPLIAALVVLTAVGMGTRALCLQVDRTVGARTDTVLDGTVSDIDQRLDAIATLLAATTAFEAGSEQVTDDELATFLDVASRGRPLPEAFPGLGGLYVVEVSDEGLDVRRVANAVGWPRRTSETLADCTPCIRSLAEAIPADGSVVASGDLPAATAEQLGGQVLLVDGFHQQLPRDEATAQDGTADGTTDERSDAWTVAAVDVDLLLDDVGTHARPGPIGVDDDQGRSLRAPADGVRLHRRSLDVFGSVWTLRLPEPTGMSPAAERMLPLSFLAMGAVLAVVVGGLVRALASSRSRALQAVTAATAELADTNERLIAANGRLQAANDELEAFSGVVAHDLKSPLTSIRGMAELVRDGRATGEQAATLLDRVVVNVDRLTTMIDSLLEYAAAGRTIGERRTVPLGPVVAEALEQLTAHIDHRDADIEVGALPTALGDPDRLTEVIQNLIGNALVHAPSERRPHITIEGRRLGDDVEVVVIDNGDGIPADERDSVLLAFHRGANTEAGTGTGLGIPTVHRIVTAHGGTLALEDAPSGGLRVRITLPAADG